MILIYDLSEKNKNDEKMKKKKSLQQKKTFYGTREVNEQEK